MPELPEVETVRQGLAQWVVGRRIASVEVRHPRAVRRHVPGGAHFADVLRRPDRRSTSAAAASTSGCRWTAATRSIGHLGMSGQLLLQPRRHAGRDAPAGPVPVRRRRPASCASSTSARSAGSSVSEGGAELPAEIAHIARDPMDPEFSDAVFVAALRRRRTEVKRALLDQTLISGVGNIYADEALWRARLHGARPTDALTGPAALRLLGHVRDVLGEAIKRGRHQLRRPLRRTSTARAATSTGR